MKDGLYMLPSDNGAIAMKVRNGIPADVCAAEGPAGVSLLKLNAVRPGWDFDRAETLSKPVPGAYDRAGFMKSLVKSWLSLPRDRLGDQVGMFMNAWAESASAFESSFALTVLISPSSSGRAGYVSEEEEARDRRADLARVIVFQPAFGRFRSAFRKDPAGTELKTKWLDDPTSVEGWEWTKEDAKEASSIMKANPAYR